jgi:hypothetical protein
LTPPAALKLEGARGAAVVAWSIYALGQ